jgi:hypothetical protein
VSALRGGGYVIFLGHTATDWGQDDQDPVVLSDCDTQRNLWVRDSQRLSRLVEGRVQVVTKVQQ